MSKFLACICTAFPSYFVYLAVLLAILHGNLGSELVLLLLSFHFSICFPQTLEFFISVIPTSLYLLSFYAVFTPWYLDLDLPNF